MSVTYGLLSGAQPIAEANHAFAGAVFIPSQPTTEFALPRLIGETVYAWTDEGQYDPIVVPPLWIVTLDAPVLRATIGLFDASHYAETLDIQAAAPDGSTMGRTKRLNSKIGVGLTAPPKACCKRSSATLHRQSAWVMRRTWSRCPSPPR